MSGWGLPALLEYPGMSLSIQGNRKDQISGPALLSHGVPSQLTPSLPSGRLLSLQSSPPHSQASRLHTGRVVGIENNVLWRLGSMDSQEGRHFLQGQPHPKNEPPPPQGGLHRIPNICSGSPLCLSQTWGYKNCYPLSYTGFCQC